MSKVKEITEKKGDKIDIICSSIAERVSGIEKKLKDKKSSGKNIGKIDISELNYPIMYREGPKEDLILVTIPRDEDDSILKYRKDLLFYEAVNIKARKNHSDEKHIKGKIEKILFSGPRILKTPIKEIDMPP